jgi:DNA-directed RNA polymerase specialized sigma24 family protein
MKAILGRRSTLERDEVMDFRVLCTDIYGAYRDTLRCVIRSCGARGAIEDDLLNETFGRFWKEGRDRGLPERLQARLLSLASGLARNQVRSDRRNPTQAQPTSSKETPGSFPRPDRLIDLREIASELFERLPPEHQAVVRAVVFEDQTIAAAARALGLAYSTASDRLTAAVADLHEMAEAMLTESERQWLS